MKSRDTSELVNIGRIGSSVGLRGEVRVNLYAPDSENLKEGKVLLLKRGDKEISAECTGLRLQKDKPVIKLEGITDRNAADEIRNMEIYIHAEDLEPLPEGEYYVRDIVGFTVHDSASGRNIGRLEDVIQNTAQSILDVRTDEGRQVLIPFVDAFVKSIDDEGEVIEVELIPGFID